MPKPKTYKLIPISQYWFNEFFAELILYRVRKKIVIHSNYFLTRSPQIVDFAMEIFGDTIIQVEEVDETRHNVQTRRPHHKRGASPQAMSAHQPQASTEAVRGSNAV